MLSGHLLCVRLFLRLTTFSQISGRQMPGLILDLYPNPLVFLLPLAQFAIFPVSLVSQGRGDTLRKEGGAYAQQQTKTAPSLSLSFSFWVTSKSPVKMCMAF
jgi:hypothetical protein